MLNKFSPNTQEQKTSIQKLKNNPKLEQFDAEYLAKTLAIYRENLAIPRPITDHCFAPKLPRPMMAISLVRFESPIAGFGSTCGGKSMATYCYVHIIVLKITLPPHASSKCHFGPYFKPSRFNISPLEPLSSMLLNWPNKFGQISFLPHFQLELKVTLSPESMF